jgi:hypothetical protein
MWLLDANLDIHLVELLRGYEIDCDTAENRGWKALRNGDLAAAAVQAGFDSLLTKDQLFAESASKNLASLPEIRHRGGYASTTCVATVSGCICPGVGGAADSAGSRRDRQLALNRNCARVFDEARHNETRRLTMGTIPEARFLQALKLFRIGRLSSS